MVLILQQQFAVGMIRCKVRANQIINRLHHTIYISCKYFVTATIPLYNISDVRIGVGGRKYRLLHFQIREQS